jgi:aspartyl/glutamyl-tRNA(Asn/Gln) amidotransferase C subunit
MLSSIDTTTISPTYQVTNLTNVTREDTSSPSLSQKEALRNASHTKDGYFQVPAIFETNQ